MRWQVPCQLFEEEWFIDLEPQSKLLWIYINTKSDAAGVWMPSFKAASMFLGFRVTERELGKFGCRIRKLENGGICIKGFIESQYGQITANNGFHRHISKLILRYNLTENDLHNSPTLAPTVPHPSPIGGAIEGEGEGEQAKEIALEKESEEKPFQEVVNAWNLIQGLPSVQRVTDKRKTALTCRLRDHYFIANWVEALKEIPSRPFLMGENNRGWKADFDWFIQPDSVLKIMEGKYKGTATNGNHKPAESHQLQETIEIKSV